MKSSEKVSQFTHTHTHTHTHWTIDSNLYKLLSSDHTPSQGAEEKAWLSEVVEVYCEEVKRRGSLTNDCEEHTVTHILNFRNVIAYCIYMCVYTCT